MLISAFTNVKKNHKLCFLTLINALWTNMNKQLKTVFLLTNINKDEYINVINALFIHVNTLTNVNKQYLIVKRYQFLNK